MVTKVTRGGQITLDIKLRRKLGIDMGTRLEINQLGSLILIEKKTKNFWDTYEGGALPKNFEKVLKMMRTDYRQRLKKVRIL